MAEQKQIQKEFLSALSYFAYAYVASENQALSIVFSFKAFYYTEY